MNELQYNFGDKIIRLVYYNMKLLHRLAIRFNLYKYHTSGCSLNIGRTWFGVWFLEGDYQPMTLNECVHHQTGELLNSLNLGLLAGDERYIEYIRNTEEYIAGGDEPQYNLDVDTKN